ncbi:hypothetical protein [Stieleria neptunia]|nr:hypothetical protein [Stieleria neptunia]
MYTTHVNNKSKEKKLESDAKLLNLRVSNAQKRHDLSSYVFDQSAGAEQIEMS